MTTFKYIAKFEGFESQGTVDGETKEEAEATITNAYASRGHQIKTIKLEEVTT